MNRLKTSLFIFLIIAPGLVSAQDSTEMKSRAFQLSFVTPLGTNGLNSWSTTNNFSLNLLTGYAGGVRGAEFSGLFSILKKDMKGAQFAGLGQVVLGKTTGAQFAGLFNVNKAGLNAWQFAGLANVSAGPGAGLQCSGLASVVAGTFSGAQFSGLWNAVTGNAKGLQVAGLGNYAKGDKVTQVSGFTNVLTGNSKGASITGFANVHTGDTKGAQIAGFANIAPKKSTGAQVSGFFNYAGRLRGVQVAPFNYVDSLEKGVPIGVLSIVRNGYRSVEFSVTETMYGVLGFKTGIRSFYNILTIGAGVRSEMILWGWGYGLGGMVSLAPKWDLAIEGLCYHMNEGEWFTNRLNLLNKLTATASWRVAGKLNVLAGISWNVTVSDVTDEYGDPITPVIAPWAVYDETDGRINVKMYPGFIVGIRL